MIFLKAYLRNLLIIASVFIGMLVFTRIFYPDVINVLPLIGEVYTAFDLWPIIILSMLVFALPIRRRR